MTDLYSSADLLKGYDRANAPSFVETHDYKLYRAYIAAGGDSPQLSAALHQAAHDAEISHALGTYLTPDDRMVAVMGSHNLLRGSPAYNLLADIACKLTREGFLIVTGGGPGAMEAAHVGAYFAPAGPDLLARALARLAATPRLPDGLDHVVLSDGTIDHSHDDLIVLAAAWLNAALEARDLWPEKDAGRSLAVPTWLYGSEPTTPFATVYAKYYQNSIREERLVAEGKIGTLYAQGGGGTVREIYQGVEHNYYADDPVKFKPMIFVDPDRYWEHDAQFDSAGVRTVPGIKVDDNLRAIFKLNAKAGPVIVADRVRFTTDYATILDVLRRYTESGPKTLALMLTAARFKGP